MVRPSVVFRETCPHCGTRHTAFHLVTQNPEALIILPDGHTETTFALVRCGYCGKGVMATFRAPLGRLQFRRHLVRLDPSPELEVQAPAPPAVKKRYREALTNIGSGSYESAIMMFRKTIQLALGTIIPRDGRRLVDQIKQAAEESVIPKELAESADVVRAGGNIAAHEDTEFSRQVVEALQLFTDMMLIYLFTLPEMLSEAKERIADLRSEEE